MEPPQAQRSSRPQAEHLGVGRKLTSTAGNSQSPLRLLGGREVICAGRDPWEILAEIAEHQRNRASSRQLKAAGFSDRMLATACRKRQLHRSHRGVYTVGAEIPIWLGRETAALLTAPGLILTGMSVLAAHRLIPRDDRRDVDVCGTSRSRPGICVHHYTDLPASQVRIVHDLPMTTVERALLDAADELDGWELERAVDEALAAHGIGRTSRTKLRGVAAAAHGRVGQAPLLALADARRPSAETRQVAAALALKLIREAGLPEPETEQMLFGFPADFFFRDAALVLEVDSYNVHGLIRANFNRDRRRDRVHRQNGLEVARVTYDELRQTPLLFIADLSAALTRRLRG